jgi:hypothetical protein
VQRDWTFTHQTSRHSAPLRNPPARESHEYRRRTWVVEGGVQETQTGVAEVKQQKIAPDKGRQNPPKPIQGGNLVQQSPVAPSPPPQLKQEPTQAGGDGGKRVPNRNPATWQLAQGRGYPPPSEMAWPTNSAGHACRFGNECVDRWCNRWHPRQGPQPTQQVTQATQGGMVSVAKAMARKGEGCRQRAWPRHKFLPTITNRAKRGPEQCAPGCWDPELRVSRIASGGVGQPGQSITLPGSKGAKSPFLICAVCMHLIIRVSYA